MTVTPSTVSLTLGGASVSQQVNALVTRKGFATTAAVTWASSDTAVATVTGSGKTAIVRGQGHGSATITATSGEGSGTLSVSVTSPDCPFASTNPLATGSISGILAISDCRRNNAPADFYRLVVIGDQNVTFDATSTAIGPQLTLFSPSNTPLTSDNPSAGGSARIALQLAAGTYHLAVTSRGGATGAYTLSTTTSPLNFCSSANALSTITASSTASVVSGSLASTDCKPPGTQGNGDVYRLTVPATGSVQLDLASSAFNAYLILTNSDFSQLTFDDNGGGNNNSRILVPLAAGTYYIIATAYVGELGNYTLTVKIP